jgi:lauroyl/myristoyl acyltransferase
MAYWFVRLTTALVHRLPDRLAAFLAAWAGILAYLVLPVKRRNMKHNLRVILGARVAAVDERRITRLARRSMAAYAGNLLGFFRMSRLLPRVFRDTAYVEGWEHLDRLLAEGRGVIFASLHFGPWDLAGAVLARHCPPGTMFAVAETFADVRLDALVTARRAAYGLGAVRMDDTRQMLRLLRSGKVLGLLVDRPLEGEEGVSVRFFGVETRIPAGAATLALLAKCPILPGFLMQDRRGRFHGGILPPIEPQRTGNRAHDIQTTMQRVVEALEEVVARSPHQWYMFRAMWPLPERPSWVTRALSTVLWLVWRER